MDKPKHDIWFQILLVTVTAVVFFLLGLYASSVIGPERSLPAEIEYVPKETVTTSVSAAAASTSMAVTARTSTGHVVTTTTQAVQQSGLIPLNTATKEQLMTISGIGETFAARIIAYRDKIGGFTSLEQLKEIEGIGEGRYQSWAPYLTLS